MVTVVEVFFQVMCGVYTRLGDGGQPTSCRSCVNSQKQKGVDVGSIMDHDNLGNHQ